MSDPVDATHLLPDTQHTVKTWIKIDKGWCFFWDGSNWIDHGRPDAPVGCIKLDGSKGDE